jgi:hypothetical protein
MLNPIKKEKRGDFANKNELTIKKFFFLAEFICKISSDQTSLFFSHSSFLNPSSMYQLS